MPLETIRMHGAGKEGKRDFQATPEELRALHERMKDPKFVELMGEYMKSLSDPETRKEEEEYLEQAEREAREGGDYSFDFIFPRPAFVVELAQPTTTTASAEDIQKLSGGTASGARSSQAVRTFVNFCVSDKVEEYTEQTTGDRFGSQWHVPVAVCPKRLEYYYENKTKPKTLAQGAANTNTNEIREAYGPVQQAANEAAAQPEATAPYCYVYDAVYHPKTLLLADRSNRFLCFLVEIAVEHINAGFKESNGFAFTRLSSSIVCIGYPKNQTIRKKGGESPFAVDRNTPVLTKPTKHLDATTAANEAQATAVKNGGAGTKTSTTSSSSLPPLTIKHRGSIDLADSWTDHRVFDKKIGVPECLVVELNFSGCASTSKQSIKASEIDISVAPDGTGLELHKTSGQHTFEGFLVLPFSVEEDPVSAKFDKTKQLLTLELKVQAHHLRDLTRRAEPPATTADKTTDTKPTPPKREVVQSSGLLAEPPATTADKTTDTKPTPPKREVVQSSGLLAEPPSVTSPVATDTPQQEMKTRREDVALPRRDPSPETSLHDGISAPTAAPCSRLEEVMTKVEEARRARERAMSEMEVQRRVIEEREREVEKMQESIQASAEQMRLAEEEVCATTDALVAARETPPEMKEVPQRATGTAAAASEEEDTTGGHCQEDDDLVYLQSRPAAALQKASGGIPEDLLHVRGEAEAAMRREWETRQSAWVRGVEEEMESEEAKAAEAAARRARREAERARQRYEAALAQEKLEEKARQQRLALPLRNGHIFAID